jgi:hypothetical protein
MLYDYIMMASLVKRRRRRRRGRRVIDVDDSPIPWFVVGVLLLRRYDLNLHPPTMDLTKKRSYSQ